MMLLLYIWFSSSLFSASWCASRSWEANSRQHARRGGPDGGVPSQHSLRQEQCCSMAMSYWSVRAQAQSTLQGNLFNFDLNINVLFHAGFALWACPVGAENLSNAPINVGPAHIPHGSAHITRHSSFPPQVLEAGA